jgi:hypothetical protein
MRDIYRGVSYDLKRIVAGVLSLPCLCNSVIDWLDLKRNMFLARRV